MKIPWWKILLSYLYDVPVEKSSSEFNEILDVLIVKGRYQLCTDKAIYSFADKYDNFRTVFDNIQLPKDGSNTLLLGFGLGSIPYMLETIFKKDYKYTGVEIDEEIIYLASKYVLDDLRSDIQLITADAMSFMHVDKGRYDMICMDIFDSDIIPEEFQTSNFLQLLNESLTEDGLLIFNRLNQTKEDQKQSENFLQLFKTVFKQGRFINVEGNMMLINK